MEIYIYYTIGIIFNITINYLYIIFYNNIYSFIYNYRYHTIKIKDLTAKVDQDIITQFDDIC